MKTIKDLADNKANDMESGYYMALKDVLKEIDDLDIELLLTEVREVKTNKKIEIPEEIEQLWHIYWKHIKAKLEEKITGESQ